MPTAPAIATKPPSRSHHYDYYHYHQYHDAQHPSPIINADPPLPLPQTFAVDRHHDYLHHSLIQPPKHSHLSPDLATLSRPSHSRSLTVQTVASMSVEAAPCSPPELSSSKSSVKSSSLHSSSPPDNAPLSDFSHFEDISLSELNRIHDTSETRRSSKPRPLLRPTQTTPAPRTSQSANNLRELNNGLRTSVTLNNHVRSLKEQKRFPIKTPSLKPNSSRNRSTRRIPSPLQSQSTSSSAPSIASPRTPPRLSTSPILPTLPVTSPPNPRPRKSAKEIEHEYNDSDDELPDEAVISNVPISPRPLSARSPSRSPERPKTSSGARGSSLPPKSAGAPECPRVKSWDAAMSDLSLEARDLTNKLEDFQDQSRRNSDDSNSSSNSQPRPTLAYKRAKTWAIPPVQRGNAMIDPLPASKEKERLMTRTRPSWLPPKNPREERKHMKEYQQMIHSFMELEKRRSAEAQQKRRSQEHDRSDALKSWRRVLGDWDRLSNTPQTRDLWWKGIPPALRGQIWTTAVGNELHLSTGSYRAALARAKTIEQRLCKTPRIASLHSRQPSGYETKTDVRARRSLALIDTDIETGAFPALGLFQTGQPHNEELRNLLMAYAAYREDTGHVRGAAGIAALLLLNHPVLTPSSPGAKGAGPDEPQRLCLSESAAAGAFIALANLLNRPLNLAFCLNDTNTKERTFGHIMKALKSKLPNLHPHIEELSSKGEACLEDLFLPLCQSLFTSHLRAEDAARVWDVLVFEGDGLVVRAAVGILGKMESGLYGSVEETKAALGWVDSKVKEKNDRDAVMDDNLNVYEKDESMRGVERARPVEFGSEDETMRWIRWAGRSESAAAGKS